MAGRFKGTHLFGRGVSFFARSHLPDVPFPKVAARLVPGISPRRLRTILSTTVGFVKTSGISTHSAHAARPRTALNFKKCRNSEYSTQSQAPSTTPERDPYWAKIPMWSDITADEFIKYDFQLRHTVGRASQLERFLLAVLPAELGKSKSRLLQHIKTRDDFIREAKQGLEMAPMVVRLTPHTLSRVDWNNPLDDPIRRQFIPLKSGIIPDHQALTIDSLGEEADSPVPGLVHRYPGRALFLATSICPVYCRFCTRAWAVGADTNVIDKKHQPPSMRRWEVIFKHIEKDKSIKDIVLSGGDCYYLAPNQLRYIGERLLSIPHIRRFRIASKGLAVAPSRIIDGTDPWASTLVDLARQGRDIGKQVCWHTHFNHPKEITWITREAAAYLFKNGVIVRNQSVLLKGVNDTNEVMSELLGELADMNIQPYYVYQCDLVRGIEDLRTPLTKILAMDKHLRGTLSGFMMPSFVVDLPGGGGKRLASTVKKYNEETGVSTWEAPGLPGKKGSREYTYYDPLPFEETDENVKKLRKQQDLMYEAKSTRLEEPVEKPEKREKIAEAIFAPKRIDLHPVAMGGASQLARPIGMQASASSLR